MTDANTALQRNDCVHESPDAGGLNHFCRTLAGRISNLQGVRVSVGFRAGCNVGLPTLLNNVACEYAVLGMSGALYTIQGTVALCYIRWTYIPTQAARSVRRLGRVMSMHWLSVVNVKPGYARFARREHAA